MRVKCSSPAQSIDKTDGLKPGEGTASREPPGAGSSPSSHGRLYPSAHSSPIISVVSFLFLGLGCLPSVSAVFPSFSFLPCSKSNSCPSLPSSLLPLAIFTFFPSFLLSFLIALSLLLSFNFSLSLLLAPSHSPLSLSLCVSFSISDEGNENNRASLILSPVR